MDRDLPMKLVFVLCFLALPAFAGQVSQKLGFFKISTSSERYLMTAQAASASLGATGQFLAAENVALQLTDIVSSSSTKLNCSSFTFEIQESFVLCELEDSRTSVAIDLKRSEIRQYLKK